MISRRLLRIKVLQIFYAHLFSNPKFDIELAHKELNRSILQYHKLYFLFLDLSVELKKFAEQKLEIEKNKFFSGEAIQEPFYRITNNRITHKLYESKVLKQFKKNYQIGWNDHSAFLKELFSDFQNTKIFQSLITEEQNFSTEKKFLIKFYTDFLHLYAPLYIELEAMSIYWNDDIEFALNMVEKTIKGIQETTNDIVFFPVYKNDDDKQFARILLERTILEQEEREKQMIPFLKNWDLQRVFVLDLYIVQLAITEFLHFPTIPIKVTINEYIDISKAYCTPKSWAFINGILDKIAAKFKENKLIKKSGRGLVEK